MQRFALRGEVRRPRCQRIGARVGSEPACGGASRPSCGSSDARAASAEAAGGRLVEEVAARLRECARAEVLHRFTPASRTRPGSGYVRQWPPRPPPRPSRCPLGMRWSRPAARGLLGLVPRYQVRLVRSSSASAAALRGRRRPGQAEAEGEGDTAASSCRGWTPRRPPRQACAALDEDRVVQHRQRLERRVRDAALHGGGVGVGAVEGHQIGYGQVRWKQVYRPRR